MVAGVDLFDDSYSSKLYVIIDADMCVDVQLESFDKKILRKTTLVLYSQYLGESCRLPTFVNSDVSRRPNSNIHSQARAERMCCTRLHVRLA